MANYGYTTPGGSNQEMAINGIPVTLPGGEALVSGWVHCGGGGGSATARCMLYATDGTLIATSSTATVANTAGWVQCAFAAEIPAAGNYVLAAFASTWQVNITLQGGDNNIHYERSASGYPTPPDPISWTNSTNGREWSMYLETEAGGDPDPDPPTITDVDSDEAFTSNATGVTFAGTALGADETERSVYLVQGAVEVEQDQGAGDDTSGTFDVVGFGLGGELKYGVTTALKVVTADGEDEMAVTINPPSGYAYVNLASIHAEEDERITAVPDLEIGDQLEYETVGGKVEILDDATFIVDDEAVTDFDVRAFDGEWGEAANQTIEFPEEEDGTPNAFSFTDATGVELSALTQSDEITVAGINIPVAISITGGQYQVNGGSWTSSAGTVEVGDDIRVRGTSSSSYSTAVNVVLTIGGVSDTFTITTRAIDSTPSAFSFVDQTGVELEAVCTSASIVVGGIDAGATPAISVSGGQYSINGGAFTSSAGTVSLGDEVRARVTASSDYSDPVTATVTIGGVSDGFTATTRAQVAPTITTSVLGGGKVGKGYSAQLESTGDGPFTWSVDDGDLPDGLTLSAGTGVISGTPTTEEIAEFTIEATNDAGSDTAEFSITIAAASTGGGPRTLRMRVQRGMRIG